MNNPDNPSSQHLTNAGKHLQNLAVVLVIMLLAQFALVNSAESCDSLEELIDLLKNYGIFLLLLYVVGIYLIYASGNELTNAGKVSALNNRHINSTDFMPIDEKMHSVNEESSFPPMEFSTPQGVIQCFSNNAVGNVNIGDKITMGDKPAKDGKYKLGFMWYIVVKDGHVVDLPFF
jgi:hypothetical protein